MTAIVIGPEPDARLLAQLHDLGVAAVEVAQPDLRAIAEHARGRDGGLVLLHGDIVTNREALAGLLADPRIVNGVLVDRAPHAGAPPVRIQDGSLVSAGSAFHTVSAPDGAFLGVLKIGSAQRELLAATAERVAPLGDGDPLALLTAGLVRAGLPLRAASLRGMVWERPATDAAVARAEAVDEERVRLDSAVKSVDGFFTTFFVSPYSRHLARWAARRGLTPNQVTVASLVLGIVCAACFAAGERWGLIAGAVLLQVAFTADCVDGQLARYTRSFSSLGAWLDSTFDRAKEWLVYAGLAIGAGDVWVLAAAALTLQTARHFVDFAWQEARDAGTQPVVQPPVEQPADAPAAPGGELGRWDANPGAVAWVKRIVALPIGERFAAISITAAIWSPRTTFIVLLAWGGFAALYGTTGRILRSRRLSAAQRPDLSRYRDDGPLARMALARAHGWLLPPLVRVAEYGGLIAFGALAGASSEPAAFALVAALALRQYDIVYGLRFRGAPASDGLGAALGGWDGRLALGCVLLIFDALPAGFYALAALIAAAFAFTAIRDWHDKEDVNR